MLELIFTPVIDHSLLPKIITKEAIVEYDKTNRRDVQNTVDVLSSKFFALEQHVHYSFYFRLPTDILLEILCYTDLRISRNMFDDDIDEGILTGSIVDLVRAVFTFCQKPVMREIRLFFNRLLNLLEKQGLKIEFQKIDFGDHTFGVKYV